MLDKKLDQLESKLQKLLTKLEELKNENNSLREEKQQFQLRLKQMDEQLNKLKEGQRMPEAASEDASAERNIHSDQIRVELSHCVEQIDEMLVQLESL